MNDHIAHVDGILIDRDTATELVTALDALEHLAQRSGSRLAPQIAAIRRDLIHHSNTRADASTEAIDIITQLTLDQDSVIDTDTAAAQLGITRDGVRWLCRTGRLTATRRQHRWWIPTTALDDYRNTH
ncbi:DNA-binding protein [Rhodococcus rhodnii]|uniref:Helix-turn-helix domain-containing protein n=2 Tax=Rhodococcus rhodnii TaxID=38312 RepID=R7WHL5_9NOCA|nr:helix-turn-helix domain-containing protein [Rhodococcus rhodnii]EOM74613.1 hypothetical protein Rrhod_4088 [Rhodococcus rhodnii LMG 5362]TXG89449.1 DNA-binding protein [Rhodococcus rhodnii]